MRDEVNLPHQPGPIGHQIMPAKRLRYMALPVLFIPTAS
jgi:hypothetical protein